MKRKIVFSLIFPSIVLCLLAAAAVVSNAGSVSAAGLPNHIVSTKGHSHSNFGISVIPSSINPGGTITVTGHGFTPGGTALVTTVGGSATTAPVDDQGNITATLTAPTVPGTYHVIAIDALTSNVASTAYKVNGPSNTAPHISVFPTNVNPGGQVTLTGSGFTPGQTVLIYTGYLGNVTFATADAHGNIGATFTAPGLPGTYKAVAVDQTTFAKASATYTVA